MAITVEQVCNLALVKVGGSRITSITENTKPALLCNAVFELIRDEVLRAHPWNFAIRREAITPNSNTPVSEYDYEYDLPGDCLRVLDMDAPSIDWVQENNRILSNEASLYCRYIFRNDDPNSWDSMFINTLAWRLARELAYALTQSSEREKQCEGGYKDALAHARSTDGAEGIMKGLEADTWTNSRR